MWGVMLGLWRGESAPIRSHAANATATPLLHEDVRLGPPGEARHARVDRHVISVRLLPHPPRGCASMGALWQHEASTGVAQAVRVAEASLQCEKVGGGVGLRRVRRQIGRHVGS